MKQLMTTTLSAILLLGATANAAPPPAETPAPRAERLRVKPGGPIAVEYRLATAPAIGAPLEIAITAYVEAGVRDIAIEATPSAPRAVLLTRPERIPRDDGVYAWSITVVPLTADAGYLSLVVSGEVDGLRQARSVTVALGSAGSEEAAAPSNPPEREAVIALPVQESP